MCEWLLKLTEPEVFIQCLIFLGLIWYACETLKLRKASREQNEIMQKPCIVPLVRENESRVSALLWSNERILDGTSGDMGFVVLNNVGNSPAFNVRYGIQGEDSAGLLPYILKPGKERTTLSLGQLREWFERNQNEEEVKLTLSYDSLSGRSYESKIHIREGVDSELVVCKFQIRP